MVNKHLGHALLYFLGPEKHENACLRSLPTIIRFKQKTIFKQFFFYQKKVEEGLGKAFRCFLGPETHKNVCHRSYPTIFSKKNQ